MMSSVTLKEMKALQQAAYEAAQAQKREELLQKNKEAARDMLLKISAIYAQYPRKD